jgi:hypothetical protein
MKYAKNQGDNWEIQIVNPSCHAMNSLFLDSLNRPHIAYMSDDEHLLYSRLDSQDSWKHETVDDNGFCGWYPSIVLDSNDEPYILYGVDYGEYWDDIRFATKENEKWSCETLVYETHCYTDMAIDSNDNICIVYFEGTNLYYSRLVKNKWTSEIVDFVDPNYQMFWYENSLALDNDDKPHISYSKVDDYSEAYLQYATKKDNSWEVMKVENVPVAEQALDNSIAIDKENNPHIAYFFRYRFDYPYDYTELKYATLSNLEWSTETVLLKSNCVRYFSLAFDSDNMPLISYYNGPCPGGLKLARKVEGKSPSIPKTPGGPTNPSIGEECTFSTEISSGGTPGGDQVYYMWDFGNNFSGWQGPYAPDEKVSISYTWEEKNEYNLRVRVKNEFGAESEWSEPLTVSVPRVKNKQNPISYFFGQSFLERFPILSDFLKIMIYRI